MEVLEVLPLDRWDAPIDPALGRRATAALEGGRILYFPNLAFPLSEAERRVLGAGTADGTRKNVSYDPETGRCKGTALQGAEARTLAEVMARFSDAAMGLLLGLAPGYGRSLERARTSFRPAEIAGRQMPWRKDDTLLHVDAFPTRPTAGRRILRVFSNVDPEGVPRRWLVGEPFEEHARRFAPRLRGPLPGTATALNLLRLTKTRRSRYDHMMLQLHDAAKRDAEYQAAARAPGAPRPPIEFPPGSTWIVYTDLVPHAALAGRNAFEQTFHLEPASMADPARAPVKVLEGLMGRALV
ncbi:MAG: Kdo hydroxylase family protein [Acetobacteraceae bacterium]|nr:Kdo hydroxylase family protein [Acetobacteraceae bacterium]